MVWREMFDGKAETVVRNGTRSISKARPSTCSLRRQQEGLHQNNKGIYNRPMRDQRPRDTFGPNDVGSKGEVQGNSVSHRDGAQGRTATPFPSFVPCCCLRAKEEK